MGAAVPEAPAVDAATSPPVGETSGKPTPARRWPAATRFIAVLFVLYVAKQVFLVAASYPFSGHDELAHFSYVRTLVSDGRLPVLPDLAAWRSELRNGAAPPVDGIPDELYPYCRFTLDWYCEPEDPQWARKPPRVVVLPGLGNYPSGYLYVANHPPLYYAAMAPIYRLSNGLDPVTQHFVLRLAAIPFGVVTVFAAYRLARALFPGDAFLAVTVPAVIALQPQISYEAAMVNNDIVAIAITSLLVWGLVVGMRDRFPLRLCLALGIGLGLGLLSKSTTIVIAPVIAAAILLALGWRDWRGWLSRGAAITAPAAVLVAPWYLLLFRTYGDLSGLNRIEDLQYWSSPMGSFFELLFNRDFVLGRFRETWGEFGWRLIHLRTELLWAIGLVVIVAGIGFVLYIAAAWRDLPFSRGDAVARPVAWQRKSLATLLLLCVLAYLAVVQFGTEFSLSQARYFFPAANAAALLTMLGLRTLVPSGFRPAGQGIVLGAMVLLNLLILTGYVLPFTTAYDEPFIWTWGG